MKLIYKSAVVAEIENLLKPVRQRLERDKNDPWNSDIALYKFGEQLIKNINTLEVKEVDLDTLGVLAEHLIACDAHGITPKYSDKELDFLEKLTEK